MNQSLSQNQVLNKPQASFFAGLEEFIARLCSFLITVLFFTVYVIASGNSLFLDWFKLLGFLALFWSLYEFIGFLLFVAFRFFAQNKATNMATNPTFDSIKPANQSLGNSQTLPEDEKNLDKLSENI